MVFGFYNNNRLEHVLNFSVKYEFVQVIFMRCSVLICIIKVNYVLYVGNRRDHILEVLSYKVFQTKSILKCKKE